MAKLIDLSNVVRFEGTIENGGGGLPAGWTESGDPADVDMHGGAIGGGTGNFGDATGTIGLDNDGPRISASAGKSTRIAAGGNSELLGFYGVAPTAQLDIDPATATPESIALRLIQSTLLAHD